MAGARKPETIDELDLLLHSFGIKEQNVGGLSEAHEVPG